MVATYQSRFRRERDTVDPVLCLEDEIRKSEVTGAAVIFDVKKACDMLCGEGWL